MSRPDLRQAALFVGVSGAGWLLDTGVFLLLSGRAGWPVMAANMLSGSCGALLVFTVSSRGIFSRNGGSMAQKVGALLLFNGTVILLSSVVLAEVASQLSRAAVSLDLSVAPGLLRLAAKVIVTPVTLALNFVVVRLLLERFVGIGRRIGLAPVSIKEGSP